MSQATIFDEVRKIWVVATPEEKVRQKIIQKMIYSLAYPRELLSVERSLSDLCQAKTPLRRVDIVCFAKGGKKGLYPLLAIECKEHPSLVEEALKQVQGYNYFLKAPFMAIVHPEGEFFVYPSEKGFSFLSYLPKYADLLTAAGHG